MAGEEYWPKAPRIPVRHVTSSWLPPARTARRVNWAAPVVVASVLLVLYLATACRSVFWYDSAEFATAAKVWGVPHPPGYPGYILIAHLFTYLPISAAQAVNLLSALSMSIAMGLVVGLCQQLAVRPLYSAMSTLLIATSDLIWANATVAEVYGPGLCFALGILMLLLRAWRQGTIGPVWFACWLAGFGLGVHYFLATLGLGYGLLLVNVARTQRLVWGDYLVALAMFTFGLTVFVLLPLRAAQGTPLNFGDPQTWEQFKWVITGGTYGQFFRMLTGERLLWFAGLVWSTLTPPGLMLAAVGLATLGRLARRADWLALLLGMGGNVACFLPYRVHDPEVFLMPALVLFAPLMGAGAEWLHRQLNALAVARVPLSYLVPGLLSGVVSYRTVASYPYQDLSRFRAADEYAQTLVEQLPEGAFIANFTTPPEWQYDAVFTYYRLVLNARPDVTMVTLPTPELLAQLVAASLPVYVYTPTADVVIPPFRLVQERALIRLELDGSQTLDAAWFDWAAAMAPPTSSTVVDLEEGQPRDEPTVPSLADVIPITPPWDAGEFDELEEPGDSLWPRGLQ